MKYLLNCNLSTDSYSVDYTLVGIFDSKEAAYRYMEEYNKRVAAFNKDNMALTQETMYDPIDDVQFKDYVVEIGSGLKNWDYDKLEADKDVDDKINALSMKRDEKLKLLSKKVREAGLMLNESSYDDRPQIFMFNLGQKDLYIDEFDGKPKCLCSYSE